MDFERILGGQPILSDSIHLSVSLKAINVLFSQNEKSSLVFFSPGKSLKRVDNLFVAKPTLITIGCS